MQHEESLIQQQCVAWFRIQYPHLAPLLYHIANEGSTSKAYVGGIRKAEGLVAGVPDLMLNIPARYGKKLYHAFGIEIKTAKGKQSPSQKRFQTYFESATTTTSLSAASRSSSRVSPNGLITCRKTWPRPSSRRTRPKRKHPCRLSAKSYNAS